MMNMKVSPPGQAAVQPDREGNRDYLAQKDFFGTLVKVAGFLAGATGLFVLFGYTIIFSFIDSVQLSGLASFQQEYYKDAAITFVADMFKSYAAHPFWFVVLFVVIAEMAFILFRTRQQDTVLGFSIGRKITVGLVLKWLVPVILLAVIAVTLDLKILSDKFGIITDIRKLMLFVIAVPLLVLTMIYLAFKFGEFAQKPHRYYYVITLLCLALMVSIPVSYGEYIFNIDLFHVIGFDYGAPVKNDSLEVLKSDISSQGEGELFYFMGHTSERDVIIDNQSLRPPFKMILVDRSLIKYLKISTRHTFTLRDLLMKEAESAAVPAETQHLKELNMRIVTEELPAEIKDLLVKE